MQDVLQRPAYGLRTCFLLPCYAEHHCPRNRYDGIEALSEIPIFDRSGPLNRLKLARAVCKAFSRFIDVRSLVSVHPSVTDLFYNRSKCVRCAVSHFRLGS
ncbi:hypothetical protein GGF50DRAFT_65062 [Schizophyllum commune]